MDIGAIYRKHVSLVAFCGLFTSYSCRIIESFRLEKTCRSLSATVNLTLPSPPLKRVPEHHSYASFKYLQGWWLNHCPGQPVPVPDHSFSKEIFPNIQSKPPLMQLEAVLSRITCYLGEETNTHLSTTTFQVVVESNKDSPQVLLLRTKQAQFPQLLLIRTHKHCICCVTPRAESVGYLGNSGTKQWVLFSAVGG